MISIRSRLITILRLLTLLAVGFVLTSCLGANSSNNDLTQISNILYEIEVAYNNYEIEQLMYYVDSNYLHNNMLKWNLRELWLDRKSEYPLLTIDFISATIVDNDAIVSFKMTFQDIDQTLVLNAPSPAGEIAYFHFDGNQWLIYGNQHR